VASSWKTLAQALWLVSGEDDGAAFVALTDDLEEEIGPGFIDREIAEFINHQNRRTEEFLEFVVEAVGDLGGGEAVDDVDGGDEAHRVAGGAGGMAEGGRQMRLTQANPADENHVGAGFDEAQAEEVLNLGAVDLLGQIHWNCSGLRIGKRHLMRRRSEAW
jgi:hypothetical protein